MMRVKELIKQLEECPPENEVTFYYLKNYDLSGCELETILSTDMQTEITIKKINTDEGGNEDE